MVNILNTDNRKYAQLNLAELVRGRDNNLALLRIIAAIAVLVSHSFVLSTGDPDAEPLYIWIGMTPGSIAVDVFFVISGFLVTASIFKSNDVLDFIAARCLRIFPALLIMLVITVFIMGPLITNDSLMDYFGRKTFGYFLRCFTLVDGVAYQLPGIFLSNPYKMAVNGSLWSMTLEGRCYIVLILAWIASSVLSNYINRLFLILAIAAGFVFYIYLQILHASNAASVPVVMPLLMFSIGVVAWQLRNDIFFTWSSFLLVLAAMLVVPIYSIKLFYVGFPFALAYIVLFFAYVPTGVIRKYNKMGDYSYGIYLYAFPIQQLLAMKWVGINVEQMIFFSFVVTLFFSVMSWHLVERNALGVKSVLVSQIRRFEGRFSSN